MIRQSAQEEIEAPTDAADLISSLVDFLDELPGSGVSGNDPRVLQAIEKTLTLLKGRASMDDADAADDASLDNTESARDPLTENYGGRARARYDFSFDGTAPRARADLAAGVATEIAEADYDFGSFEPQRTKEVPLTEGLSRSRTPSYNFAFDEGR